MKGQAGSTPYIHIDRMMIPISNTPSRPFLRKGHSTLAILPLKHPAPVPSATCIFSLRITSPLWYALSRKKSNWPQVKLLPAAASVNPGGDYWALVLLSEQGRCSSHFWACVSQSTFSLLAASWGWTQAPLDTGSPLSGWSPTGCVLKREL